MARSSAESAGSCFIEQIPSTRYAVYAPAPKGSQQERAKLIENPPFQGAVERERRNIDIKAPPIGVDHAIGAGHQAGRRRQAAARSITKAAAGLENGGFADHAR